jgi:hypothetical protein
VEKGSKVTRYRCGGDELGCKMDRREKVQGSGAFYRASDNWRNGATDHFEKGKRSGQFSDLTSCGRWNQACGIEWRRWLVCLIGNSVQSDEKW